MNARVMPSWRRVVRSALAGLVCGTLILGVGGRLLMRGIALASGGSGSFSLGGSLEVVAVGALYGTLGGLLLLAVPRRLGRWRSPTHACSLLVIVALSSAAARGAAAGVSMPGRLIAVLAFGGLFLAYSFALTAVNGRDR